MTMGMIRRRSLHREAADVGGHRRRSRPPRMAVAPIERADRGHRRPDGGHGRRRRPCWSSGPAGQRRLELDGAAVGADELAGDAL